MEIRDLQRSSQKAGAAHARAAALAFRVGRVQDSHVKDLRFRISAFKAQGSRI